MLAVIGPSDLALMRRLPVLWTEREPTRIGVDELAHSSDSVAAQPKPAVSSAPSSGRSAPG